MKLAGKYEQHQLCVTKAKILFVVGNIDRQPNKLRDIGNVLLNIAHERRTNIVYTLKQLVTFSADAVGCSV